MHTNEPQQGNGEKNPSPVFDDEVIREFLIESNENLNRLDTEIVDLERNPTAERLASIFRTIHTIKGTCGFLGFESLEGITHHAENILSQLRSGQKQVNGAVVSLILETVDAVRRILANVESTGGEGAADYAALTERLEKVAAEGSQEAAKWQEGAVPQTEDQPGGGMAAHTPAVAVARPPEKPPNKPVLPTAVHPEIDKGLSVADTTIRVDVSLLDKLMNLLGELVLARNQILQFTTDRADSPLTGASQRLNLITSELQEGFMKTRMQPIGVVWNKLPRVVRDVAHSLGKQIDLKMEGADTELDRTIIEAIKDPLTHLVRNSCDHGIEDPERRRTRGKPAKGTLCLKAYHEGGQVNIEIFDDGAGVDVEKVRAKAVERGLIRADQAAQLTEREAMNLLFLPGFSTAGQVTNVSGRGVGMDVVKANVEKIGGAVDIVSVPGLGTTVKLKIPLTLAIIPGLLITSAGQRFVIPQVSLLELIRLEDNPAGKIDYVHDVPVYRHRGRLLPIAYLNEVLKLGPPYSGDVCNIVVLQAEHKQFGLVVDGVNDTQEIVVKPLGKQLNGLTCYSGSTIMGDGEVALILDVPGIGRLSGVLAENGADLRETKAQPPTGESDRQRLLIFKAGSFERLAVPLSLVSRLEEFSNDVLERANGRRVVQYRERILPLVSLQQILEPEAGSPSVETNPLQVVVFGADDRCVGIIVDQIIDIVDETVGMRRRSRLRPGLLGSGVVGKRVADFLDLQAILRAAGEDLLNESLPAPATLLLADSSAFNRGLLRNQLEMAGYRVIEATTSAEMVQQMEAETVNLLVAGLDLIAGDPPAMDRVRRAAGASELRMIGLADSAGEIEQRRALYPEFDDYQVRFESEGMLRSIERLSQSLDRRSLAPAKAELRGS
jgi:two-component system chemotaxis sensor kinase CheA